MLTTEAAKKFPVGLSQVVSLVAVNMRFRKLVVTSNPEALDYTAPSMLDLMLNKDFGQYPECRYHPYLDPHFDAQRAARDYRANFRRLGPVPGLSWELPYSLVTLPPIVL